ncbi:MAG: hypothetical protein V4685_18350 [Bacteroidota bacterium]
MKKLLFTPLAFFFLSFILLGTFSCKKSEPTAASAFTWRFDNGTTISANIHKAFTLSSTILATKGSNILSFDVSISLSSFNANSYTITAGSANGLTYIDNSGNSYSATSGTINITSYANSLISGNFTASVTGSAGGPYPITGSFTDTPVEF